MNKVWIVQFVETTTDYNDFEYISDKETKIFINKVESLKYAFNKALCSYEDYKQFCCNVENGKYVDGCGVKWDDSRWNTGEPNFNHFGCYNLKLKGKCDVSIVTHEVDLNSVEEEGYNI